ncbi:3936_t:CDS:2 [Scutellospora calospora]|uniref:3936_t:CDS:1 n=1 Tax=Scutellospora calospora TaxID=85575 RepID=A0ACA9K2N4_9GLOM|nr:3936_t:CDS:2 [Scutellospora calospora]
MKHQRINQDTTPLKKFCKFFKRLYQKKPKPACQAPGCSNLCSKKDIFCSNNCKLSSKPLPNLSNSEIVKNSVNELNNDSQKTSNISTPLITISYSPTDTAQANPQITSSFFTRILERKKSTESEFSGDEDNLSSNGKDKSRKSIFLGPKMAINSQSSISSEVSSDPNDSAYESTSLETESPKISKKKENLKIGKTIIQELKAGDESYEEVKKTFQQGLPANSIIGIFQLQMPTKLVNGHEAYKNKFAKNLKKSKDNVTFKMFHGTKHNCDPQRFIDKRKPKFCRSNCGLCGIAQEGNQSKFSNYSGKMWFAVNSYTSLGYCGNINIKTMFVVDVIAERCNPNGTIIVSNNAHLSIGENR